MNHLIIYILAKTMARMTKLLTITINGNRRLIQLKFNVFTSPYSWYIFFALQYESLEFYLFLDFHQIKSNVGIPRICLNSIDMALRVLSKEIHI